MDGRPAHPDVRQAIPQRPGAADPARREHQIVLRAREHATIAGVQHVESFDEHEVVLKTELGALKLLGQGLQIKQLNLEQGTFSVDGRIDSLSYDMPRSRGPRPRGLGLGRLFR